MLNFTPFLERPEFAPWQTEFTAAITRRTDPKRHGDLPKWLASLTALPNVKPSVIDLTQDALKIGQATDISPNATQQLHDCLQQMIPWRKGPFDFFGIHIDTEWRSDWKWQRVSPHLQDLTNRRVLDVGCGTGYHGWRMLGDGARYVLGIDPSVRFAIQHAIAQHYIQSEQFDFLPIGIEDLPNNMRYFDTVFSMGILYHRRDPLQHLRELQSALRPGGELVLETLVVDNDFDKVKQGIFTPDDRYAMMRNVWSLATISYLTDSLKQLGFNNVRCVDVNITSTQEQRTTDWMTFHSLQNFLDPNDSSKTVEGHPAPKRATLLATNA